MQVEEIYRRVFAGLRPSLALPVILVRFYRFTSLTSNIRLVQGELRVKISDLLVDAPEEVQEALAYILLSKLFRQRAPAGVEARYREYVSSGELSARLQAIRQERGRKLLAEAAGKHYDLEALFEEINQQYFGGTIAKPRLGWSLQRSRTVLGHYDAAHHAIAISAILDQRHVPRYAVTYVLYHEILHIKHPVQQHGTRRSIHPPSFRLEEKQFPEIRQAKAFLRRGLT